MKDFINQIVSSWINFKIMGIFNRIYFGTMGMDGISHYNSCLYGL